ncbi:protein diaphanous homolog 1-like [Salvia splendens]|uniref:protein diaphanous homolog 1-like n=1 Tax=Salvia splendens TaxID=180675 RepID=UPI001C27F333|nr:protein diaphanous homolog 1-like [Salvia splendens]
MATLVTLLVALAVTANSAAAVDYISAASTILQCADFLRNPNPTAPGGKCCTAAKQLLALGDAKTLCDALKPLTSTFLPTKAKLLPDICNLPVFSPLVTCLAPSSSAKADSLLPPLGPLPHLPLPLPLPPIFQLPPLGPLPHLPPLGPLPPIFQLPPIISLPPFLPTPPSTA